MIACLYKATVFAETFITPALLPSVYLRQIVYVGLWALYGCIAGLFGMGIWVIAHECGHQAFSESKTLNNAVGWVLHSACGVPYHSWRISHAKHHASTGHMTQDQAFVPWTRTQMGLPPLDPENEDVYGSSVSDAVKNELWEALGDSPIGAAWGVFVYFVSGLALCLLRTLLSIWI